MAVREARGSVPQAVLDTARCVKAPLLVTDRGYERILRAWRQEVAAQSPWCVRVCVCVCVCRMYYWVWRVLCGCCILC